MSLELDGIVYDGVESGAISIDDSNMGYVSDENLTLSWTDTDGFSSTSDLFKLRMRATKSGNIREMIKLSSAILRPEAYVGNDLEILSADLFFTEAEPLPPTPNELFQNVPNPFTESTSIAFTLAKEGYAKLTIYDYMGRLIRIVEAEYDAGLNQIALEYHELCNNGIFFYQLETEDFSVTKKMILLD